MIVSKLILIGICLIGILCSLILSAKSSIRSQKSKTKTFYLCGVDWQHEIGHAADLEGKMPLYSSVKILKKQRTCWEECGIVKVKMEVTSWVQKQNLWKK
jgi:hypothetical protein